MFILIHAAQASSLDIGLHTHRFETQEACLEHMHKLLMDEVLEALEIDLEDLTEDENSFYYGLTDVEEQINALIEHLEEIQDTSHKYIIEEI